MENCSSYKEIKKQIKILNSYKNISNSLNTYTDGSKRLSRNEKILIKLIARFAKIYYKSKEMLRLN